MRSISAKDASYLSIAVRYPNMVRKYADGLVKSISDPYCRTIAQLIFGIDTNEPVTEEHWQAVKSLKEWKQSLSTVHAPPKRCRCD